MGTITVRLVAGPFAATEMQGFAFFSDKYIRFKFAGFFMGAITKRLIVAQATGAISVLLAFFDVYMTRFGLGNNCFTHLIPSLMRLKKLILWRDFS